MSFIVDLIIASPSAYIGYQFYRDRKIVDMYKKTGLDDIEKIQECDVSKPSKWNYVGSMIPIYRWYIYHDKVNKDTRTLDGLVEVMNEKVKCEECNIVSAYWMYSEREEQKATCPQCQEKTKLNIIQGEDKQYPFFKRKNKKEIVEMLERKAKGQEKIEQVEKITIKEEQLRLYEELKEKKKEVALISTIK